jgi:hypothetical protein
MEQCCALAAGVPPGVTAARAKDNCRHPITKHPGSSARLPPVTMCIPPTIAGA